MLSIMVATLRPNSLKRLSDSLERCTAATYELLTDSEPGGPTKAINRMIAKASGEWIVWLCDDCEVTPAWDEHMMSAIHEVEDNYGKTAIGAFYFKQPFFPRPGIVEVYGRIMANYGMMRRSLALELGPWDEQFFSYGADPDFSLRAWQAGIEVIADPKAWIIHHEEQDTVRASHPNAADQLFAKWDGVFTGWQGPKVRARWA